MFFLSLSSAFLIETQVRGYLKPGCEVGNPFFFAQQDLMVGIQGGLKM